MNRTQTVGIVLILASLATDVALQLAHQPVPAIVASVVTAALGVLTPGLGAAAKEPQ